MLEIRNSKFDVVSELGLQVVRDVSPLRPLVVNESGVQANLWLGAAGIQTFTHYDASWNFFGQLHGRKRFTLISPDVPMSPWPCAPLSPSRAPLPGVVSFANFSPVLSRTFVWEVGYSGVTTFTCLMSICMHVCM